MSWTGEIHITEMARVTRVSRTILYRWRALKWLVPTSKVGNSERFTYEAYQQACAESLKVHVPDMCQWTPKQVDNAPAPSVQQRIRSAFGK